MQWIIENWLVVLVGGGMLAMHLFGHGHKRTRKSDGDGDTADQKAPAYTDHTAGTTADQSVEDSNA